MRFDIHLRASVRDQVAAVAEQMKDWEHEPRLSKEEVAHIRTNLTFFEHTTRRSRLRIAGVDGSGDYPALNYADSFVYVSVAQCTVYESDTVSGLREPGPLADPLVQVAWVPEEERARTQALNRAFAELAGMDLLTVLEESDYRTLKDPLSRKRHSLEDLATNLIYPHAADAGNLGLQLRSAAEMGALLRLLASDTAIDYAFMDGTFSLPLVAQRNGSLFYEHLKRLCCVKAREKGVGFLALSKSHGLPAMDTIEEIAINKAGFPTGKSAEHWYLRLPIPEIDGWELGLAQGRRLPPPGTVSYLVRFHQSTPVMRLDLDFAYWREMIRQEMATETAAAECKLFQDLDYACHDQRCYGYPYPLKAAHDRVSLTQAERVALRTQIVDAAIQAGMKRALFRDASQATGHR